MLALLFVLFYCLSYFFIDLKKRCILGFRTNCQSVFDRHKLQRQWIAIVVVLGKLNKLELREKWNRRKLIWNECEKRASEREAKNMLIFQRYYFHCGALCICTIAYELSNKIAERINNNKNSIGFYWLPRTKYLLILEQNKTKQKRMSVILLHCTVSLHWKWNYLFFYVSFLTNQPAILCWLFVCFSYNINQYKFHLAHTLEVALSSTLHLFLFYFYSFFMFLFLKNHRQMSSVYMLFLTLHDFSCVWLLMMMLTNTIAMHSNRKYDI